MDIYPLGHASFKLKGKMASVVTDPYDPKVVGLKFPKHTTADIVTISHNHPDHNFAKAVESEPGNQKIVLTGPGEYEVKGIDVVGIATFHDGNEGAQRGKNVMYKIDIDGMTVLHCGDLGHKLTEEQVEVIDNVDILLIPVGGFYTIDAATAGDVVTQLEPSIVIPMHYNRDGLDPKAFGNLTPLANFLKVIGQETVMPLPKLKVTKDSLPQETQVVILE